MKLKNAFGKKKCVYNNKRKNVNAFAKYKCVYKKKRINVLNADNALLKCNSDNDEKLKSALNAFVKIS